MSENTSTSQLTCDEATDPVQESLPEVLESILLAELKQFLRQEWIQQLLRPVSFQPGETIFSYPQGGSYRLLLVARGELRCNLRRFVTYEPWIYLQRGMCWAENSNDSDYHTTGQLQATVPTQAWGLKDEDIRGLDEQARSELQRFVDLLVALLTVRYHLIPVLQRKRRFRSGDERDSWALVNYLNALDEHAQQPAPEARVEHEHSLRSAPRALPCVVRFHTDVRDVALAPLVRLLAQGLVSSYQDSILVIDARSDGPSAPVQPVEVALGQMKELALSPRKLPELWEQVRRQQVRCGYIFVLSSRPGAPVPGLESRLALLTETPHEADTGAFHPPSVIYTAWLRSPDTTSQEFGFPSGTVRLMARGYEGADFQRLEQPQREALLRWGRAITWRVVGVSLSGGGAWGFNHVAFLQELLERQIPIDLVSGTSFGSVVGAFFCAQGLAGLDRLLGMGSGLGLMSMKSVLCSKSIQTFVDRALDEPQLEALEVRFYPVCLKRTGQVPTIVYQGTLGEGVRKSSAFPGVYSAVVDSGEEYFDGGFFCNVPVAALWPERANLLLSSNAVGWSFRQEVGRLSLLGPLLIGPLSRIKSTADALFSRFYGSGTFEQQFADVNFTTLRPDCMPWHFNKARDIVEQARQHAERASAKAQRKWTQLLEDRRRLGQ
jgi:predicted acylesterase/phospholipase RssA